MCIVENLNVEGIGAALEQQLKKRFGVRLPRRILLALPGDADERGVARIAGHVEIIWIGARIQHP